MTQPTAADTTNTQDPEQRAAALQQIWEETMAMEPDPNDPRYQSDPNSDYQTDYENWAKKMQLLGSMVNAAQNVASKKDTAISQAQEQQRIGLAADSNATQRSVADINRYLGIQSGSTNRAQLQQQAREQVGKYGTSGGKTRFSAADFGGALTALAGQAGVGAKKMQLLGSMVNAAQNVASKKDTAISQAQEQQRIGLAADSNATQRSVADINRYLGIQSGSTNRAQLQQQAREQVGKYGTSGGKTRFSAADFGGALTALAGQAGVGANDTLISYPGYQSMNPGADLAAYDQAGGASGPAPGIAAPQFTGGNALPTVASYASAPPAAPSYTAPFNTDVNMPDGSVDLAKWLADHSGGRNAPPAVGNVTSVLTPSVTSALPTPGTPSMLPWWLQKAGAR